MGGGSQAVTRLNFIVDAANQAYFNSDIGGQLRLVRAVQVDYPDSTLNRTALFELSGVTCTVSASGAMRLPDTGATCTNAAVPAGALVESPMTARPKRALAGVIAVRPPPSNQATPQLCCGPGS